MVVTVPRNETSELLKLIIERPELATLRVFRGVVDIYTSIDSSVRSAERQVELERHDVEYGLHRTWVEAHNDTFDKESYVPHLRDDKGNYVVSPYEVACLAASEAKYKYDVAGQEGIIEQYERTIELYEYVSRELRELAIYEGHRKGKGRDIRCVSFLLGEWRYINRKIGTLKRKKESYEKRRDGYLEHLLKTSSRLDDAIEALQKVLQSEK